MNKLVEPTRAHPKPTAKGKASDPLQALAAKQPPVHANSSKHKGKSKSKSKNKTKSRTKQKIQPTEPHSDSSRHNTEAITRKPNLLIQSRKRLTASQDKKEKQFRRKNNRQEALRSASKKESKRSTDNENEETLVERLRAENEYYRKAFMTSKESLERMETILREEKQRRSHEKEWYQHQITNLRRKLSADKIRLGHIFSYESFQNTDISNMIIETENEGSSLVCPTNMLPSQTEVEQEQGLSDLSIDSK